MSFVEPFLRGRVLVKRVASVCGMIVVLPLMGCGSQETVFKSSRDARLAPPVQASKPMRPVLASAGGASAYAASGGTAVKEEVAVAYGVVPTSASYKAGGVQRSSLAPLAEPAAAPAGYALGAVDTAASARPGQGVVREASNHGRRQAQPYATEESDYREADEARQSDYAPEPRPGRAVSVKPEPRGGGRSADYIVQPGDTLYAIAQRTGVSVDELLASNGLRSHEIYVGQLLRLEGEAPAPQGKAYRAARPEPRGYREPVEERPVQEPALAERPVRERPSQIRPAQGRPAPERAQSYRQPEPREAYRAQDEDTRGYRGAPSLNVYEQRQGARYVEPEQQARSYQSPYAEERPGREGGRGYSEPQQDDGRPEYTSSNSRYTPDGPFEPSPDAPWRGESEWRRMKPQDGRTPAYEQQAEPRYEGRRGAPAEAYDGRPTYQRERVERSPDGGGRTEREALREPYPAPSRGGPAGGRPAGAGPVAAYSYTVQRGDTLSEIARRSGVDQRELAAFNGLPPDARLTAGQDLRIPQGRGHDWSRPRPEAAAQQQPAPRQAAPVQAPRAPVKAAAAPATERVRSVQQADARPQAASKVITDQLPQRLGSKPAEPQMVQEEAAPPAAVSPEAEPQAPQRMAAAPAEPAADVSATEAAPAGATATAHAVGERPAPRECETLLASPQPRSAKTFRMPVQGMVIAKFGVQNDGSFNDGINFSVPKGTPVKAAENGVVAYAGDELPGFGNLVLIRHADGFVTAYAHNDELLVNKCDVVERGQVISKAGATGKATSPQLHFELRKDSKPMDPGSHFSGT